MKRRGWVPDQVSLAGLVFPWCGYALQLSSQAAGELVVLSRRLQPEAAGPAGVVGAVGAVRGAVALVVGCRFEGGQRGLNVGCALQCGGRGLPGRRALTGAPDQAGDHGASLGFRPSEPGDDGAVMGAEMHARVATRLGEHLLVVPGRPLRGGAGMQRVVRVADGRQIWMTSSRPIRRLHAQLRDEQLRISADLPERPPARHPHHRHSRQRHLHHRRLTRVPHSWYHNAVELRSPQYLAWRQAVAKAPEGIDPKNIWRWPGPMRHVPRSMFLCSCSPTEHVWR